MDRDVQARFEEIDEVLSEMEERLRTIARQNAVLADMVEVLGSYVNTGIEHLQAHVVDPDAHRD